MAGVAWLGVLLYTKRCWLDSWSGHKLGLWAPSPVGGAGGSDGCYLLPLMFVFSPYSLKIYKNF